MTNPTNSRRQEVLDALPGSHVDVIVKTGMHRNCAGRWLKRLHAEGAIYIYRWTRTPGGGPYTAHYALGQGRDAVCRFKRLTGSQRYHRHAQMLKVQGEWEGYLVRRRAIANARNMHFDKDPLLAWIPVRATLKLS